ncbi:serine/threonine-protein kinase [Streptomyces sp. NPDC007088]|uniref:serine/threonine-protein kinase n=1 Tax=Streptomyces sp. NPDC007088 TaxID=3364773 RepID=UPI003684D72F
MSDQGRLVVGRYRLVERVGRGGMGTVWRAEDELLGRHVAVKKLHVPPHLHESEGEVQRLYERTRREARSAARITHPNVTVVHDVVDDEGLPCIVMEYVPSVTLADVLKRRGALPPAEAARIGGAMAAALRAAHAAGVLHRDVKPGNVLLGHDGRVVLTDFGIAVEPGTSSLTRTGELVGSVHYLAPERLRSGIADPGPACDLWSLGATLYQAVEGQPPYDRDTAIETAYAIAAEPYGPPRRAGALTPVIEGLLVKDPARRMTAPEAARLLGLVAGTGTGKTGAVEAVEAPTRPQRLDVPPAPEPGTARSGVTVPDHAAGPPGGGVAGGAGRRRRTVRWSVAAAGLAAAVTAGVLLSQADGASSASAEPRGTGAASAGPAPSGADGSPAAGKSAGGSAGAAPGDSGGSAGGSPSPGDSPPPPVPEGYRLREAGEGFSVPVREGWKPKGLGGGQLAYIDPTGLAGLRVDVIRFAGSDPLAHWRDTEEEQTRRDSPGYERVRMAATTFRGRPAGYWEFTFKGRVRDFRAVELALSGTNGTQYLVYLSAPQSQWEQFRPAFDTAVNGMRFED